jgi:hypothetical protein
MRRVLELASAPAYQASTTVRNSPNELMATMRPTKVNSVRSLWRNAFLNSKRNKNMSVGLAAGQAGASSTKTPFSR